MTNEKEFRVVVGIRNNLMQKKREALGVSQAQFCREHDISPSVYASLESLGDSPMGKRGWRLPARKIADAFRCMPEDLWPDAVLAVRENKIEREADALTLGQLPGIASGAPELPSDVVERGQMERDIRAALSVLTDRDKKVLMESFGLVGEDESHAVIGARMGISRGRVGQIEQRALRKLRGSAVARQLLRPHKSEPDCWDDLVIEGASCHVGGVMPARWRSGG